MARVGLEDVVARDGKRRRRRGPLGALAHRQRHLARELQRGERGAGVAAGKLHDLCQGVVVQGEGTGEAVLVAHGAAHELGHRDVVERLQLHHARAADKRRVNLEVGVLGGGTDEDDDAVLHGVEQRVLLRAAEAVDLVHEEDGARAARHEPALRGVDLAAQVLDGARDGRNLHELRVRGVGNDARERGLARAGRAVEDDAREHVVLDGATQPRVRAHRLLLAHVLGQRLRPHPHRQRRVHVALVALDFAK